MNYTQLPYSDLGLSVRAHPFKNVFELCHLKTPLMELNKKKTEIVTYLANSVITSAVGP